MPSLTLKYIHDSQSFFLKILKRREKGQFRFIMGAEAFLLQ